MMGPPGRDEFPIMCDRAVILETQAVIRDTGVEVYDVEVASLVADSEVHKFQPLLELAACLRARTILVTGDDSDESRLIDRFGELCHRARALGLNCDLEFIPWRTVGNLSAAMRILQKTSAPNAGILLDPIHFFRTSSTLEEVRSMPREWLHYAQICDAAAKCPDNLDDLIRDAREERLNPGEGELDLAGLFGLLPLELPIAIEVPKYVLARTLGPRERARIAVEATRRVAKSWFVASDNIESGQRL
jgi:sugar phosphate isomerase/epimerase